MVILAGLVVVCLNPQEWIGCHSPKLAVRILGSHSESPVFDFTTKEPDGTIGENHVLMNRFQIFQLDKHGNKTKTCWEVEAPKQETEILKQVEYGKAPSGWKEIIPPESLQSGGIYSMTEGIVFLKEENGYKLLPGDYHYPDRIARQLQKMGIAQ